MSAAATSIDRATINAANAQHSTGPQTEEGKERAKFNAFKSGLFARTIVLPHEDQAAYEALGEHFEAKYQPDTNAQRELVITIQNTTWRLHRAVEMEHSLYAIGAQQQLETIDEKFGEQTPEVRYSLARAAAYLANAKAFDQISRQEGRLQRALDRATRELLVLISARVPSQEKTAPTPAPNHSPGSVNGFVPSKYPADMPDFSGQPHMNEKRRRWLRQNGYKNLN